MMVEILFTTHYFPDNFRIKFENCNCQNTLTKFNDAMVLSVPKASTIETEFD